ncbi:ankyrin repeat [Anaeramoeba flamelloides]|uniref:Ankyrin repeat n=1 Tax=Anaeramoeba flamelloides TaxID=1746091 RepID=A0ABQ8XTA5_9EUKA|nr:ankyrin repeat [Anaeramoeba flamelloides]
MTQSKQYPLHKAVVEGTEKEIKKLLSGGILKKKIKPDSLNDKGLTPIQLAVRCSKLEVVKLLLKYKADPTIKDQDGRSPLFYAVANQNFDLCDLLLDRCRLDLNETDNEGKTPALFAASTTEIGKDFIIYLKVKGSPFDVEDKKGVSFITQIQSSGRSFLLRHVLPNFEKDKYEIMNKVIDSQTGNTALHHSILNKKHSRIPKLIGEGADPKVKNKQGLDALWFAIHCNNLPSLKELIQEGAVPSVDQQTGNTLLHYAVSLCLFEIVDYLRTTQFIGEMINVKNIINGSTPLNLVCTSKETDDPNLIELLIKSGADPQSVDNNQNTPFLNVCLTNLSYTFDWYLEFYKTNPRIINWNCVNKNGDSCLHLLAERIDDRGLQSVLAFHSIPDFVNLKNHRGETAWFKVRIFNSKGSKIREEIKNKCLSILESKNCDTSILPEDITEQTLIEIDKMFEEELKNNQSTKVKEEIKQELEKESSINNENTTINKNTIINNNEKDNYNDNDNDNNNNKEEEISEELDIEISDDSEFENDEEEDEKDEKLIASGSLYEVIDTIDVKEDVISEKGSTINSSQTIKNNDKNEFNQTLSSMLVNKMQITQNVNGNNNQNVTSGTSMIINKENEIIEDDDNYRLLIGVSQLKKVKGNEFYVKVLYNNSEEQTKIYQVKDKKNPSWDKEYFVFTIGKKEIFSSFQNIVFQVYSFELFGDELIGQVTLTNSVFQLLQKGNKTKSYQLMKENGNKAKGQLVLCMELFTGDLLSKEKIDIKDSNLYMSTASVEEITKKIAFADKDGLIWSFKNYDDYHPIIFDMKSVTALEKGEIQNQNLNPNNDNFCILFTWHQSYNGDMLFELSSNLKTNTINWENYLNKIINKFDFNKSKKKSFYKKKK